jgi:hypothetical protein
VGAQFGAVVAAPGMPQLQIARLGDASCDFAGFFAAALVGAILARRRQGQLLGAVATFLVTQAFNELFPVTETLPATVPPAIVIVALGAWHRREQLRSAVRPFPPAPAADPGRR